MDNRESRASSVSIAVELGWVCSLRDSRRKLLEIDRLMTPARQRIFQEVHPEVSFCEMSIAALAGQRLP